MHRAGPFIFILSSCFVERHQIQKSIALTSRLDKVIRCLQKNALIENQEVNEGSGVDTRKSHISSDMWLI